MQPIEHCVSTATREGIHHASGYSNGESYRQRGERMAAHERDWEPTRHVIVRGTVLTGFEYKMEDDRND